MKDYENALKLFTEGNSCSQSILGAYGHRVGLDQAMASKMGSGLGGGIGRKQYICGAINAGAIILGLKYSTGIEGDADSKNKVSEIVYKFTSECEKVLGSSQCFELLKVDLLNPIEKNAAKESGHLDRICNNAVVQTGMILEKYLQE